MGKIIADDRHFEIFVFFPKIIGFGYFMQIFSSGENLHEMSHPMNKKEEKNISLSVSLIFPE